MATTARRTIGVHRLPVRACGAPVDASAVSCDRTGLWAAAMRIRVRAEKIARSWSFDGRRIFYFMPY